MRDRSFSVPRNLELERGTLCILQEARVSVPRRRTRVGHEDLPRTTPCTCDCGPFTLNRNPFLFVPPPRLLTPLFTVSSTVFMNTSRSYYVVSGAFLPFFSVPLLFTNCHLRILVPLCHHILVFWILLRGQVGEWDFRTCPVHRKVQSQKIENFQHYYERSEFLFCSIALSTEHSFFIVYLYIYTCLPSSFLPFLSILFCYFRPSCTAFSLC